MRRPLALSLVTLVMVTGAAATAGGVVSASGTAASSSATGPPGGDGVGWQPHVRSARRYAQRRAGDVRFAIIGLDARMSRFDAGRTAPAASVFKVMLLAAYLRQPSVRHRRLHARDRALLAPMIRRSDNVAATRVRDIVGRRAIERLARAAGMRSFRYNQVWGLSRTNPRDQVLFMDHLERYIPARHQRYARELLGSIVRSQRWGVARVRPRGWKLYFKGGWATGTGRVDHQVAFLDRYGHRVALAIFTEFDPSHAYGERTLQGVAGRLLRGLPRLPRQL